MILVFTEGTRLMVESLPIVVLDEPGGSNSLADGDRIVSFDLDVLGKPVRLQVGVKDKQARLADIVPAARALSSKIVKTTLERLKAIGAAVPCRKGCSICCAYLISISVPEALRLAQEMMKMPLEQRRDIMERSSKAAEQIGQYVSKHFAHNKGRGAGGIDDRQLKELSAWYAEQELPCPFLRDSICMIYEQRPVNCREHLVVGSTMPCRIGNSNSERRIEVPVRPIRMRDALRLLAGKLEGGRPESVVLPHILDWYRENAERRRRTWSAVVIAEQFIEIVRAVILANNAIRVQRVESGSKRPIGQAMSSAKTHKVEEMNRIAADT